MPRIDDPNINLKKGKVFKRKSLRPWDNFDDFKPRITENKLVNNQETISKQLVNNQETISKRDTPLIGKQLVNDKEANIELVNNQETISKPIGKQGAPAISKQLVNQLVNTESTHTRTLEAVKQLCGLQRKLLFYIVEDCKSIGLLHTMPITNESLRILLNTDAHSVKTTVQRLTKKGMVNRKEGKSGRGGYTIFTISESVRNAVIETHGQLSISKQLVNQLVNANGKQLVNNWETNGITSALSSSSSVIDLKTTTTNFNPARELAEGWREVEYSLLADFGFTQTHLLQLSKLESLEPSIVQDSIYHFAFDLKHNNKASSIKGDPLSYFMGIVSRRGAYTAPSNYIDPALEAMNAYHKSKEQSEKQKAEIEQKVQEIEFRMWHDSLSDDEILLLLPEEILNAIGPSSLKQRLKVQHLKKHYVETLWPERRRELCKSTPNWMTTEPVKP